MFVLITINKKLKFSFVEVNFEPTWHLVKVFLSKVLVLFLVTIKGKKNFLHIRSRVHLIIIIIIIYSNLKICVQSFTVIM